MIVKTSDFQLEAYVPNKNDAPFSDIIGNEGELQGFIDEYEKHILIRLLGITMYNEYIAQFEPDGTYIPTVEQKWKDLTDGKLNYRGIKPAIIGYIFYKFLENDSSHYTTSHVVKEKSQTADRVSSRPKAIMQYRKFLEYAIGSFYAEPAVYDKPSIFGNLSVVAYVGVGSEASNFKSLYQYLYENSIDFPNWEGESFKNKNYYDI